MFPAHYFSILRGALPLPVHMSWATTMRRPNPHHRHHLPREDQPFTVMITRLRVPQTTHRRVHNILFVILVHCRAKHHIFYSDWLLFGTFILYCTRPSLVKLWNNAFTFPYLSCLFHVFTLYCCFTGQEASPHCFSLLLCDIRLFFFHRSSFIETPPLWIRRINHFPVSSSYGPP